MSGCCGAALSPLCLEFLNCLLFGQTKMLTFLSRPATPKTPPQLKHSLTYLNRVFNLSPVNSPCSINFKPPSSLPGRPGLLKAVQIWDNRSRRLPSGRRSPTVSRHSRWRRASRKQAHPRLMRERRPRMNLISRDRSPSVDEGVGEVRR